jgi:dTDP-4-amino-4,6-dideoxygalactose transaminase
MASVNSAYQREFEVAWKAVFEHGRFVTGPEIEHFEASFADFCESTTCIGAANGTDALTLILACMGIGPGDEVIVPTNTFVATAEAVRLVGARLQRPQ